MAQLVVLVLDDPSQCTAVMDAWDAAGTTGITMLESTGLQRVRNVLQGDVPLFPSLRDLLTSHEAHHRTLFTLVRDDVMVDRIIEATQRVIGDLNRPNTGILFVVPLARVLGLNRQDPSG
jgi:nitrogen regulatory protein PII